MTEDKELYDAIRIAIVVGIVLTLAFNLYMRERIQKKEGFSEIYFNDHRHLPKKLRINESEDISFTLSNHELRTRTYTYEIDSKTGKFKENITLISGQRARVRFTIKPENNIWSLNFSTKKRFNDSIDVARDHILARDNEFNLIIDNTSLRYYLPISHNVEGLGYVYHTNLSVKELEKKPFKKTYNESFEGGNQSIRKQGELTLSASDGRILLDLNETEERLTKLRDPFIVKFYTVNATSNDVLEIHFWYELVE